MWSTDGGRSGGDPDSSSPPTANCAFETESPYLTEPSSPAWESRRGVSKRGPHAGCPRILWDAGLAALDSFDSLFRIWVWNLGNPTLNVLLGAPVPAGV